MVFESKEFANRFIQDNKYYFNDEGCEIWKCTAYNICSISNIATATHLSKFTAKKIQSLWNTLRVNDDDDYINTSFKTHRPPTGTFVCDALILNKCVHQYPNINP